MTEEEKTAEEKPAEEKTAEEKPAEEKPAEEKPAEEKPAEEKTAEKEPADEEPAAKKAKMGEKNGGAVDKIPKNFVGFIPYLVVKDAWKHLELYEKAFGAKRGCILKMPDGEIAHAEVYLDNTSIMFAEEGPTSQCKSPVTMGGTTVTLTRYVEDMDAAYKMAVDAGMEVVKEPKDYFYGDRMATVKDPSGYEWTLATHLEDLTEEQLQTRMEEMMKSETKE